MPSKSNWKSHERQTARHFGTNRTPMSGAMASLNTHSDSFHSKIYFESKYRQGAMVDIVYSMYDDLCERHAALNVSLPGSHLLVLRRDYPTIWPVVTIRQSGKRGNLICFHIKHIEAIAKNLGVIATDHLQRKKLAIWTLWEDTLAKADFEGKIPVLSIKKARRQGFLLVLRPKDLQTVFSLYGKSDKQ